MKLNEIQQMLKVPKEHKNSFANYNYRNCEDILNAVKPLLGESILLLSDEIVQIGDRFYVKATATFIDHEPAGSDVGKLTTVVTAYAREPLEKKGSDASQITGAASSYARKYALCGLFAIDDGKDADSEDNEAVKAPETSKKDLFEFGEIDNLISSVDADGYKTSTNVYFGVNKIGGRFIPSSITSSDFDVICLAVLHSENIATAGGTKSPINLKPFPHEVGTYFKFSDSTDSTGSNALIKAILAEIGVTALGITVFLINRATFKAATAAYTISRHNADYSAIMRRYQTVVTVNNPPRTKADAREAKPSTLTPAKREIAAKARIVDLIEKLNGDKPAFVSKDAAADYYGAEVYKYTQRSLSLATVEELESIADELSLQIANKE